MNVWKRLTAPVLAIVLTLALLVCVNAATAAVSSGDTGYTTLAAAVAAVREDSVLQLNRDITETLTISKNVTLDLNGFKVNGTVTVADGYKLTLMDSTTDDFSADTYGLIKTIGNAQAAKGYLAIAEESGTSYHRLDLTISSVNLRPGTVGIYYGSNFGGDEAVKAQVECYGTALSLTGAPTAQEIKADKYYSRHTAFSGDSWVCGATGKAYGSLLTGIWKSSHSWIEDEQNAQRKIYSASYVQMTDGTIVLGETVSMSLKELVEKIDIFWDTLNSLEIAGIYTMYEENTFIMDDWNTPNLVRSEGHNLDKGVITSPATVYDEGVKLYICKDCEFKKDENTPKIDSFTVTFYNKGDAIISDSKYELKTATNQISVAKAPVVAGYAFKNWVDTNTGKDIAEINFATASVGTTYQFKPVYVRIYQVTFAYYKNDRLTETVVEMVENQVICKENLPEIPSRTGYSAKWDEGIVGTQVTRDLTFSPVYEILNFTVTFLDAANGKIVKQERNVEYGATVIAPECEPYYYTMSKLWGFTGWRSASTGELIARDRIVVIQSDLTLYPVYESSIEAPVIAAHIEGETVTMSLCMPDNTTLYSIKMSVALVASGPCEIDSASIVNTTSLNKTWCSSNSLIHIEKNNWLTYNNKTRTFDFIWSCGAGHSFKIDRDLITLKIGVNDEQVDVTEEIFRVLKGSNIVYGEKGANISSAKKTDITLWFY